MSVYDGNESIMAVFVGGELQRFVNGTEREPWNSRMSFVRFHQSTQDTDSLFKALKSRGIALHVRYIHILKIL